MGSIDKKKLLSAAYYYSCTRFTLNLFSLIEDMSAAPPSDFMKQYAKKLTEHTGAYLEGETDFCAMEELRGEILGHLDQVMQYLNCFSIHGYALDRVKEKLFGSGASEISPDALAGEVMDFVMDGGNDLEINRRVQTVVGELPVRFTKRKFYSVIEESLKSYCGRDRRDLDRMTYNIRSAAALPILEKPGMGEGEIFLPFQEIHDVALELERCDYLSLTREEYEKLSDRFETMNDKLSFLLGQLVCLPELINDLYVMERALSYAQESSYHSTLEKTLRHVLELFQNGGFSEEGDNGDADTLFQPLEGKQEYYWEQYMKYLGKKRAPADSCDEELFVVLQLLSGSFGATLKYEPDFTKVTEQILAQSLSALFTDLEARLKRTAKFTSRAVMAKVLSEIPVWFNSLEEIETYIKDSLALCLDTSEKNACMANLKRIVVEGNALV